MHKAKIGRNDPCPCGSGKKYKNCCLSLQGLVTLNENDKPFDLYSQLISTTKLKLDHTYQAQIKKMRKPLQDRFMRLCTTHHLPQEQESFFSDWLWFDMTDNEGTTFSSEYLREHGDSMELPLRHCLQALNDSYLSVYEPIAMEGSGLQLRDFITGQNDQILLKEPLDLEIGTNKPLLLGRLVAMPQGKIFSGMVLMLNNNDGQGEFIINHIKYLQKLKGAEIPVILKHNAEILFAVFEHANHKALMGLNDIRVWQLPNQIYANLVVALDKSEACDLAHETGGTRWYDLHNSLGNARLGLNQQQVISYADILNDALLLTELVNGLVSEGDGNMVHSLFLCQPPAPELDHIWYTVVKEQETERWLHTVHSELDDKTPLEVLAEDEDGRERIFAILDSFASQTSGNEYSIDLLNYMRLRIE